jgi:hypothetical protein
MTWVGTLQAQQAVVGTTCDRTFMDNGVRRFKRATILEKGPTPSSIPGVRIRWSDGATTMHSPTDKFLDAEVPDEAL